MTIQANHAGTSWPKPAAVVAAVQDTLLADPDQHAAIFAHAYATISSCLDLPAPHRLLLTSSGTQAFALLIADLPWQPGDDVVISSLEHHALARPVQRLLWERGVVMATAA